jgi:hypothetical protein
VCSPFSGANKIPAAAPIAAPPTKAAIMLSPFIVVFVFKVSTVVVINHGANVWAIFSTDS